MKKKILFLLNSLNGGGLENYVLRFLTYNNDITFHVLCKSGETGDLENEYKSLLNVKIFTLDMRHKPLISSVLLYKLFKKQQYDAICDFTGSFGGIPIYIAKLAGVKRRMPFYRNSSIPFKQTRLRMLYYNWIKQLTLKYSTALLSNSQAAFDNYFGGRIDNRFKVIYNGIDFNFVATKSKKEIRHQLGIPIDSFVIGHTGRYTPMKNHNMIFKVASRLCEKFPDVYFLLVGRDVPNHKPADGTSHIICLDYSKNIPDLLNSMDLYYFPSLSEGQPNALIEAMVVGLPIVASAIAPIRETVPLSMHDKLVSPFDEEANFKALEYCRLNMGKLDNLTAKNWALFNFDASKQFGEFRKVLIN